MDVERLQQLANQYPEVQELLKDNYSLSVALLAKRIEDRLALFDGNHTRAQAKLVDRMKQLEDRGENASSVVRDLRKRTKELESQDTDRTLRLVVFTETLEKIVERIEKLEEEQSKEVADPVSSH